MDVALMELRDAIHYKQSLTCHCEEHSDVAIFKQLMN